MLFTHCFLNAQAKQPTQDESTIDSLINVLKILSSPSTETPFVKGVDTIKINTLTLLTWEYIKMDNYEQALEYAQQMKQQSEPLNYQKGVANAYNIIGIVCKSQSNYEEALENYLKALAIRQTIADRRGVANVCK